MARKKKAKNINRIIPLPGQEDTGKGFAEMGFTSMPAPMALGKPSNISLPDSFKNDPRREYGPEDMWYLGVEIENAEFEVLDRFFHEVVLKGKPMEKWKEEKAFIVFEEKFSRFNAWRKKKTAQITKKSKSKQEFVLRIKEAMRSYK